MVDLDIRLLGKKQSRTMMQFHQFKTHEEAISFIMTCIELITACYECDREEVIFTVEVTKPDVITLYQDNRMHAIFKVVER